MTVTDLSTLKVSDVIKSLAEAAGVSQDDVVVKEMKFKIKSKASFDSSVTLDQARTTIAKANDVQESQVTVTEARRRLSAGLLAMYVPHSDGARRLAAREIESDITTSDASQALQIQTSAADATRLTQALQQVAPSAPAPTITQTPTVQVAMQTQLLSSSSTPVAPPSTAALTQSLQTNMGQSVQVAVSDLGSTSCSGGVCASPGDSGTAPASTNPFTCAAAAPSMALLPLLLASVLVSAGSNAA